MRRYSWIALLLAIVIVWPAAAVAQEESEMDAEEAMTEEMPSPYSAPDEGWKESRFHIGGLYGDLSGGTALGLVENVFFRTQFNMGSDTMYGLRAGYVFAARWDVELEYGVSSPGLEATLTDLAGQGKTEVPFADLDMTRFTVSVNYSMIERTRRVVPYLTVGFGSVGVSSDEEGIVKSRKPGLIYGGGLRVRIVDMVAFRIDARGLRSGFGTKQEEDDLPGVFVGDFNASNFLWSVGLDIRF
ncbi:MAG: outer membrane beta-barrel protein [Acidobacteria bacterium]|nr:outer membrane beta-barrel protein [Acidobacteriota bacterium]